MAEMSVAIMVVSLPSMRSFIRRGGIFSSNKHSAGSSGSRSAYGLRTPVAGSKDFMRHPYRSKRDARVHTYEDSGSEVELNTMGRTDVIYETRHISVQFSKSLDEESKELGRIP
jgi:hypothetical protein